MKHSIKLELISHVQDLIEDGVLTADNRDDWHHIAFNESYYIVGYYQADQWLKRHQVSPWEAIEDVIEWERDTFGEVTLKPEDINAEKIVNLLAYVYGELVIAEMDEVA